MADWLTEKEAIRSAFKYRNMPHNEMSDEAKTWPILLTDFDRKNLRVVEVTPGDWDDWRTWTAITRTMTDREAAYIDWKFSNPNFDGQLKIGAKHDGCIVRGYIKRPGQDWATSLNIDEVRGTMDYGDA